MASLSLTTMTAAGTEYPSGLHLSRGLPDRATSTAAARVHAYGPTVGNLANGSTVSGVLSNRMRRILRYGYRSDDYNLQNIAAGTRGR